jgi:hypothetical protein
LPVFNDLSCRLVMVLIPCTCSRRRIEQRLAGPAEESPGQSTVKASRDAPSVCCLQTRSNRHCGLCRFAHHAPAGAGRQSDWHDGRHSRGSVRRKWVCRGRQRGIGPGAEVPAPRWEIGAPSSRNTKIQWFGPLATSGSLPILSCKTTFSNELWTSSFPLYSMKPNLRNLFMKKLTRARVVPIISARVS